MKPVVDITNTNGSRWSMGRAVADALSARGEKGVYQANVFLSRFNPVAGSGTDDEVIAVLLEWADLVLDGVVITQNPTEALAVPEPKELSAQDLEEVKALDVARVGYAETIGLLADAKEMLSQIEAKRKDLTKGARETIAKINAELKPGEDRFKEAEKILKAKLVAYRADINAVREEMLERGEVPVEPVPEVPGVSVRRAIKLDINEDELPEEFFTRVPDEKKIKAALKKKQEIPGVVATETETLAIQKDEVER